MSGDWIRFVQQRYLKSSIRNSTVVVATLCAMVLGFDVHAQPLEQAISRALFDPNTGACDARMNPTRNLLSRICGLTGNAPGASGGSTSSLSREVSPVEERKEQRLIGPFNVFISGEYERLDKDRTRFESGFKTDSGRALVGADYSFSDRLVLGGAFKYSRDDGEFNAEAAPVPRGSFHTDSYGGLLHVGLVPAPKSFLDATFGYTRKNYFLRRGVAVVESSPGSSLGRLATGTADGSTNGNDFKAELNGGYNFSFQNITIGPRLGLNYRHTAIDGFTERRRLLTGDPVIGAPAGTGLELIYSDQHENSLTSVLGVYGSVALSTSIGVLVPQTTLEYVHEFLDPQRHITFRFRDDLNRVPFRFENDPPDRNYFNLGAGVVLVLPRGFSPFLNYRALVGYNDQQSHIVTAGLRVEF